MGFNMRGDKNSLALLSSKRVKAYTRTRADEAFALPSFSDAMPIATTEPQQPTSSAATRQPEHHADHGTENVKQTMLQHESLFKEQLHELHRLCEKQRALMAESKQGETCHPRLEPPSSNSSLLFNPDTVNPLEDRSFGDIGVTKSFNSNQSFFTLPSQMDDVKPYKVNALHKNQHDRPLFDLERPAEVRPIFDLERPAEEYMDIEVVEEKPRPAGTTCKLADVSDFVHNHVSGGNRDPISGVVSGEKKGLWGNTIYDRNFASGEKRDFATGEKEGLRGNSLCTSYDARKSDRMCEGTLGSKEKMYQGSSEHEDLACKGPEYSGMRLLQMAPSMTRNYSHQEAFSRPIQTVPDSGPFRGLPDLNGELNPAEQQTPPMERRSEKTLKDRPYIDLEADSRSSYETSKLPHWLCQGPPALLTEALPFNSSAQTSGWQQKATLISSQMHNKSKRSSSLIWGHGETLNTSTTQESYPWAQIGTSFQQGEISYREPPSAPSLQIFSGASTGAAEGCYIVADTRGFVNEGIPSFLSHVRDSENVDTLNASGCLSSHPMDRQGPHFETELLSGVNSREATALSTLSPWYQQGEYFSSLTHQASNPEPPNSYPVTSVNPSGTSTSHQVLPMERCILAMHTNNSYGEGPSHLPARSESFTKDPVFDFMHAKTELRQMLDLNMEGNETTTWRQVDNPFSIGQVDEVISSRSNQCDQNTRRNFFDLNVSYGQCCAEENFDACQITESRCVAIQKEDLKQECEANRSSDWHILSGIKAPHSDGQQPELDSQATRVANKLMASEVLTAMDTIQSQNDIIFFTEVDTRCSRGDMLGNDTCADYCSGEDETGGGFVEVKSSDGSGLTSCESRDAVHLELEKARDYSNTSSGEACQSRKSRIPGHKEDAAFSSNVPRKRSIGLPVEKVDCVIGSQELESFLFSTMQSGPVFSQHDTKRDCPQLICSEFGDESEEAANSSARKHLIETAEAAVLLLSLGLGYATNGPEKSLHWLADIIPREKNCEAQVLDAGMAFMAMHQGGRTELASEDNAKEKILDPFELAVLALKPINPEDECPNTQAMDTSKESCPSLPNLRRRSSRRGRAGKDFQGEMLRSMISLSRHEITEDLQIIEGLIKSTTEAVIRCSLSPEEKLLSSPEVGSLKDSGEARGTKACRGRKLNGTLNVCSWGESTRRKRMGRQRSQWLCLPPGVQTSLLVNNAGDGFF